ncbi:MAG TPA: hypothetical protein VGE52_00585, partial [Pirellulales bacterium]
MCLVVGESRTSLAAEATGAIDVLKKVGPEGQGVVEARAAWEALSKADVSELPTILASLDGADPLPANYIRAAAETIVARQVSAGKPLPTKELEAFLLDQKHEPRARRMVFEWLTRNDAATAERLTPLMLNDPSVELRRDAVARLLALAEKSLTDGQKDAAKKLFGDALAAARDDDQVTKATDKLKELGETVDLPKHFGFIMEWKLIAPFDNRELKGFNVAYPPEKKVDFAEKLVGQDGKECVWADHVTADARGIVNLNEALGKFKGAVSYAVAEFTVDKETPVQFRLGCATGWKLWLNGEFLFGREEYHRGIVIDQYQVNGVMKPGKNQILLKVCQNEQTEDWAQEWK